MSEKTTSNTYLYCKSGAATKFTKLIDIKSYPDIFTKPDKLDVSDLSSNQKKYEPGMVDIPDYDFEYFYSKTAYDALKALEGTTSSFQIRFGETGEYGAWQWDGDLFATPKGGKPGDAREGSLTCYPSTNVTAVTITGG